MRRLEGREGVSDAQSEVDFGMGSARGARLMYHGCADAVVYKGIGLLYGESQSRTKKTTSPCPKVSHRTRKVTLAILVLLSSSLESSIKASSGGFVTSMELERLEVSMCPIPSVDRRMVRRVRVTSLLLTHNP